jgi:hypothetical protein
MKRIFSTLLVILGIGVCMLAIIVVRDFQRLHPSRSTTIYAIPDSMETFIFKVESSKAAEVYNRYSSSGQRMASATIMGNIDDQHVPTLVNGTYYTEGKCVRSTLSLSEAKALLEKAVRTDCRIPDGYPPSCNGWQCLNLQDKIHFHALWLLGGQGSYTDHIIPTLGYLEYLWHLRVIEAPNDVVRVNILRSELKSFRVALRVLDSQIRINHDFVKAHPDYSGNAPGFFSYQVEAQRGDRSWNNYHWTERVWLKQQVEKLPSAISIDQYEQLRSAFPGVIG